MLTTGFAYEFFQHFAQMVAIGFHVFGADALNIDVLIDAVNEVACFVIDIGEAAGHASAEVGAGVAEYGNHAAGHVFTAMIADAFNDCVTAGIAHRKTFTGCARGEQLAAGCAV